MAIRDLAPCLLFRWLWVIIAGQQQKRRSWRASVECSRPVGEKNNSEGGKGEGSRAMEEGLGNQEIIVVWKLLKTKIYILLWHVTILQPLPSSVFVGVVYTPLLFSLAYYEKTLHLEFSIKNMFQTHPGSFNALTRMLFIRCKHRIKTWQWNPQVHPFCSKITFYFGVAKVRGTFIFNWVNSV